MMKKCLHVMTFLLMLVTTTSSAASYCVLVRDDVQAYINHITRKYHFDQERLNWLFSTVIMNEEVITHLEKPAEAKPWYEYQDLIVTQEKIDKGVEYWRTHEKILTLVENHYGVPASIIVAIIGIESKFGENKGIYPVFNTLATLSFNHGRREEFFRSELTEYLLLARDNGFKPLLLKGSYAGALGLPQFMPSSYRHYAVDFCNKGYADLFNNDADAIGSIGNYLKKHGWKSGDKIVIPAEVNGDCSQLYKKNFKPYLTESILKNYPIAPGEPLHSRKASLIRLEEKYGYSHWLGLQNFYVISTYNKSELYVMAVSVLAEKIREQKHQFSVKKMATIPKPEQWEEPSDEVECTQLNSF